jgi:hypothetical protein
MTPITETWLRESGFRWEQCDRQPTKHWLLWLAEACIDPVETSRRMFASSSTDLGIEIAQGPGGPPWYCWLRADYAGRYSRFMHVRYMANQEEVVALIEALTGRPWKSEDVMYGSLRAPEVAARLREDEQRLDKRLAKEWGERVVAAEGLDEAKNELIDAKAGRP